jgi:hypothetical protein
MLDVVAHVAIDMRVIERRQGPDAHKFPSADLDDRNAEVIVEVRDDGVCHTAGIRLIAPHHSGGSYGFLAAFHPAIVKKPQIGGNLSRRATQRIFHEGLKAHRPANAPSIL